MGQLNNYSNIFAPSTLIKSDEVNTNLNEIKNAHNATDLELPSYTNGSRVITSKSSQDGLEESSITVTKLNYLSNVSSDIQAQITAITLDVTSLENAIGTTTLTTSSQIIKTAINELNATKASLSSILNPDYVPFSVNNGLISINKVSNTEVSFTIASGGMVLTYQNGKTYTLTTVNNVTGISSDGTYDFIFKEADIVGGNTITPKAVLSSKVNETTVNGTGGSDGDLNTNVAVKPLYSEERTSGIWAPCQYVKAGAATKTSGTLGTPITYGFNGAYNSGELAISLSTISSVAHNIGLDAKFLKGEIKAICKVAEANYSIGDYGFNIMGYIDGGRTPLNIGYSGKNTAIYNVGSQFQLNNRTSNGLSVVTAGNWRFIINVRRTF